MGKRIAHIVLDVLCVAILLGTAAFLLLRWGSIPDQVPSRYSAAGEIEARSVKGTLLLLPAMAAIGFVALSFAKILRVRSFGREVRIPAPELLFPLIKLPLVAGFCYITVCSALIRPLGIWFLPVFLGLTLLPLLIFTAAALTRLRS